MKNYDFCAILYKLYGFIQTNWFGKRLKPISRSPCWNFSKKDPNFPFIASKREKNSISLWFLPFSKKKIRFFQFFSKEFWDRFPFSRLFFLKKRISLFNIKNCDETFTKENSTNFCENLLKQRIFTKII